MILRRFSQHLKEQNWFAVGLDVIVVIVGIFLGMQVAEWNEELKNEKVEAYYLKELNKDLIRIEDTLQNKITFEQDIANRSERLFTLLEEPGFSSRSQYIGALLIAANNRRTVSLKSPIFMDIQSSGKIGLIVNNNLRNKILDFFSKAERAQLLLEKNSTVYVDQQFTPFLISAGISYRTITDVIEGSMYADDDELFDKVLQENTNSNILSQNDKILQVDEKNPIWDKIRVNLSWRFIVAVNDKAVASELLERCRLLHEDIREYLDKNNGY